MAYSTLDYTPPSLPEVLSNLKTFEDVRSAVGKIVEYLQRLQAADVLYFNHLRENLNQSAITQGPNIAAAPSITVTKFMHVVTGTATISNIYPPMNFAGQLMLVSQDGFTLSTGGNISMIQPTNFLAPGANIMLTYIPSTKLWYADTCRLQNAPSTLMVHGHQVVTE